MTFNVDGEEITVCPICRRARPLDLEGQAKFRPHTTSPDLRAPMCVASGKTWDWAQFYARNTKAMGPS